MVAEFSPLRFKSNAPQSLGQHSSSNPRVATRFAAPAIADSVSFSHQPAPAQAAPQFGISLKGVALASFLTLLGGTAITTSGCKKDPNEINASVTKWNDAIKSQSITNTLKPGTGYTSKITVAFKDDVQITLPGTATLSMPVVSYETGKPETVWTNYTVSITKTNKDFTVHNENGVIAKGAKLVFGNPLEVEPRTMGEVPKELVLDTKPEMINPADVWQYPNANHTENMFKGRFSVKRYATEGQATTDFVNNASDIATLDDAKAKIGSYLKRWGANDNEVNALKAKLDDEGFKALNAQNVHLMVAALINEVKHPGHIASLAEAPKQQIGNGENSTAQNNYYSNGTSNITYGKYAVWEDPDLLALLQRTELMEKGGNNSSRQEQLFQKIVMLREYGDLLEKRPEVAKQTSGLIRVLHTEASALLRSGGNALFSLGLPNIHGKGALETPGYNSYATLIDDTYPFVTPNENASIPSVMQDDLTQYFALNGTTFTTSLQGQLDTNLRSKWDITPLATAIGLKTY